VFFFVFPVCEFAVLTHFVLIILGCFVLHNLYTLIDTFVDTFFDYGYIFGLIVFCAKPFLAGFLSMEHLSRFGFNDSFFPGTVALLFLLS